VVRLKCSLHSLELGFNSVIHRLLLGLLLFCNFFYDFIQSCEEKAEVIRVECGLHLGHDSFFFLLRGRL
jgi:hypothetical protein